MKYNLTHSVISLLGASSIPSFSVCSFSSTFGTGHPTRPSLIRMMSMFRFHKVNPSATSGSRGSLSASAAFPATSRSFLRSSLGSSIFPRTTYAHEMISHVVMSSGAESVPEPAPEVAATSSEEPAAAVTPPTFSELGVNQFVQVRLPP